MERKPERFKFPCVDCKTVCSVYTLDYQYSNHLMAYSICPNCQTPFWTRIDLTILQLQANEKAEIEFTFEQFTVQHKLAEVDELAHNIYELTKNDQVEES